MIVRKRKLQFEQSIQIGCADRWNFRFRQYCSSNQLFQVSGFPVARTTPSRFHESSYPNRNVCLALSGAEFTKANKY